MTSSASKSVAASGKSSGLVDSLTNVSTARTAPVTATASTVKAASSAAGIETDKSSLSKALFVYSTTRAATSAQSVTTGVVSTSAASRTTTVLTDSYHQPTTVASATAKKQTNTTASRVPPAGVDATDGTATVKPVPPPNSASITDNLCSVAVVTTSSAQMTTSSTVSSATSQVSTATVSRAAPSSVTCGDASNKTCEGVVSEKSVDTSLDSVSTALSVLLNLANASPTTTAASAGGESPSSPKCSYRYGSRGAVSGIYRRKLGLSTLDQYTRNMDQLYGGGEFFGTMSASVDSITSPTSVRQASVVSPLMTSSLVISSPTASFRETGPDLQASMQKKGVVRPSVPPPPPPPPPPSSEPDVSSPPTVGPQKMEMGGGLLAALDDVTSTNQSRPKSTAPHIARRAFLYGDVGSPTSDEFKLFEETSGETSAATPSRDSQVPESLKSNNTAYDPSAVMSTLYIDDEDWHAGNLRPTVAATRQAIGRLRGKRKSDKQTKSVTFDPCSLLLSAAATGELDVITSSAPKVSVIFVTVVA